VLSPIAWLANKLYAIEEKSKEVANSTVTDLVVMLACLLSSTTVQISVQFSATITLPDLYTRINLYTELYQTRVSKLL
jgi:hypothetical protein